mgnify:CR=1 FL=1
MKDYTFTLEDGRDVQVRVVGEYADRRDHDWTVGCGDLYEEVEEDDGQRVVELIEDKFTLSEKQARFVEMVIIDVMGHGFMTLDEALDNQAQWELAPGYTSKDDVIDQYIRPTLGDFVGDYDLDAIFDEAFGWEGGKIILAVPEDEYYEVVARHDLSAK